MKISIKIWLTIDEYQEITKILETKYRERLTFYDAGICNKKEVEQMKRILENWKKGE